MSHYGFPLCHSSGALPAHPFSRSFLYRALAAGKTLEQRLELLNEVDWNTPDVHLSIPWEPTPGHLQCELVQVHPLATVAQVGDEELFVRALELAQEKEIPNLEVGQRRSSVRLSDWVSSQVLATACQFASPKLVAHLVDVMALRAGQNRSITVAMFHRHEEVSSPWAQLARTGSRTLSPDHYRQIVAELDRFVRTQMRAGPRSPGKSSPRADGRGRLSRWELDLRRRVYSASLVEACRFGNLPMAAGVLESGFVQVSPAHVDAALNSGAAVFALQLLCHPTGQARWMDMDLNCAGPTRPQGNFVFDVEELDRQELSTLASSMGRCFNQWEELPKSHPAVVERAVHQDALVEMAPRLIEIWKRFPSDSPEAAELSNAVAQSLLPLLLRLDDLQAKEASEVLLDSKHAPRLTGLPSLEGWDAVLANPQSPWAQILLGRLAALGPKSLRAYLEDMATPLVAEWREWGEKTEPSPFDAQARLTRAWELWAENPHLPKLSSWLGERLSQVMPGRGDLASWVLARALDDRLSPARASRPAVRL